LDQCVITRVVKVAPGRFAPGHLGELTQQVPFEMVDAVLAQTGRVQSRARAGVRVRMLLGDPDSEPVAERGVDEGVDDAMAAKIRNATQQGPEPDHGPGRAGAPGQVHDP
jgi:hypothetical protein